MAALACDRCVADGVDCIGAASACDRCVASYQPCVSTGAAGSGGRKILRRQLHSCQGCRAPLQRTAVEAPAPLASLEESFVLLSDQPADDGSSSYGLLVRQIERTSECGVEAAPLPPQTCAACVEAMRMAATRGATEASAAAAKYRAFSPAPPPGPSPAELEQAAATVTGLTTSVAALQAGLDAVRAEQAALDADEARLDRDERAFGALRTRVAFQRSQLGAERDGVLAGLPEEEEESGSTLQIAFEVGRPGAGVLNGAHLDPGNWPEANLALGHLAHMLVSIARYVPLTFSRYEVCPLGAATRVRKRSTSKAKAHAFWTLAGPDISQSAVVAVAACVGELCAALPPGRPPYRIEHHSIGGVSSRTDLGTFLARLLDNLAWARDRVGASAAAAAAAAGVSDLAMLPPAAPAPPRERHSLRKQGLTQVPPELWQLSSAVGELDLSENLLSELPTAIASLSALSVLDASRNALRSLPRSLGALVSLTSLVLTDNELTELPAELGQLQQLVLLDVSHNRLRVLCRELGELGRLEVLRAAHNVLEALPPQLPTLTTLDVSDNRLRELPATLSSALMSLRVADNRLPELPPGLAAASSLTVLDASGNELQALPAGLALPQLRKLLLARNRLTAVPRGAFAGLEHLDVSRNHLESLAGAPATLVVLNAAHNALVALPPRLPPALQLLELSHNAGLRDLGGDLSSLTELAHLGLKGTAASSASSQLLAGLARRGVLCS